MRSRRLASLALVAVLGASCSGDRLDPDPTTEAVRPRCAALPGRAPRGFVQVAVRDVAAPSHVGTHRTYRSPGGARLDVLLGAVGQVGEGMRLVQELELPNGSPARLLGQGERWALVWEGEAPCLRNGILAEGMGRSEFLGVLERMGLAP